MSLKSPASPIDGNFDVPPSKLKLHTRLVGNPIILPLDGAIRSALVDAPRRISQIFGVKIGSHPITSHIAGAEIQGEAAIEILIETIGSAHRG